MKSLSFVSKLLPCVLLIFSAHARSVGSCPGGFKIAVDGAEWEYEDGSGVDLRYEIQETARVSSAWVEIWDGGKWLWHQQVPVKSRGELVWEPTKKIPSTPSQLQFAIFNPDLRLLCSDACSNPPKGGTDYRSIFWAGKGSDEDAPFSLKQDVRYRTPTGSDGAELTLEGQFIGAPKAIALEQSDDGIHWIVREYAQANVIDREHASVQIPQTYLEKPGIVGLSIDPNGDEQQIGNLEDRAPTQRLYIFSAEAPVISSVVPSELSADEVAEGPFILRFVLHGSGFTPASRVVDLPLPAYDIDVATQGGGRFISPNELTFEMYRDKIIVDNQWSNPGPIRVVVANGDWLHLSEPAEISIRASSLYPLDPAMAPPPKITSISPDPVPLADPAGPASSVITIQGEHFQKGESVVAMITIDNNDREIKLETEFVSSQELRARLPRELWSEHRLRVRFGVQTSGGPCVVEMMDDDDD